LFVGVKVYLDYKGVLFCPAKALFDFDKALFDLDSGYFG